MRRYEDGSHEPSINHIEGVVNSKVREPERGAGYGRVTFSNKEYYDEALRISMNPKSIIDSNVHPIYKFVPHRLDEEAFADPAHSRTEVGVEEKMLGSNLSLVVKLSIGFEVQL